MTTTTQTKRLGFTRVQGTTPIPSEAVMLQQGFRKTFGLWAYCKPVGIPSYDVTLNFEINPETGEWGELVLDEAFGQPYYYGLQPSLRDQFIADIDRQVRILQTSGLTGLTVNHHDYGVQEDAA